jgi:hypothetical protein
MQRTHHCAELCARRHASEPAQAPARDAHLPEVRNGGHSPCPCCGRENPPDVPYGSCEVCDAHWYRHGYDTWDEYQGDLDQEPA